MVAPLVWLLVFDVVVCLVWWGLTSLFEVTAPDKMMKLMIGIVILINAVVIIVWMLGLFGLSPSHLLEGPSPYRR